MLCIIESHRNHFQRHLPPRSGEDDGDDDEARAIGEDASLTGNDNVFCARAV